jgi:hypothetical protein
LSTKPVRGGRNRGAPDGVDAAVPLAERAAAAADAELRGERSGILGAIGRSTLSPLTRPRRVPDRWSFFYVLERMEEGFRTLSRLPLPTRPRGYINSMPTYLYDRADLNSQLETHELERMARMRNRVRIPPSPAEIARMDENRELQASRHADNSAALRELAAKLDQHAESVEMIRPTVAALEMSRSKIATWASVGFAVAVLAGWVVEAAVKWAVGWVLSHFQ